MIEYFPCWATWAVAAIMLLDLLVWLVRQGMFPRKHPDPEVSVLTKRKCHAN